jgi:hypothetical protein
MAARTSTQPGAVDKRALSEIRIGVNHHAFFSCDAGKNRTPRSTTLTVHLKSNGLDQPPSSSRPAPSSLFPISPRQQKPQNPSRRAAQRVLLLPSIPCLVPGAPKPRGEDERQGRRPDSGSSGWGRRAGEGRGDWRRRRVRRHEQPVQRRGWAPRHRLQPHPGYQGQGTDDAFAPLSFSVLCPPSLYLDARWLAAGYRFDY